MVEPEYVLSDLSQPQAASAWQGFSDRVMGGVSQEHVTIETIAGRRCIRLRGEVRLENRGGFIQVALPLTSAEQPFDARRFRGVRILVWGNTEEYRIHLRTSACRRPQQYYWAAFHTRPDWQIVDLPFAQVEPKWIDTPFQPEALTRFGLVAYGRPFQADVALASVALYA